MAVDASSRICYVDPLDTPPLVWSILFHANDELILFEVLNMVAVVPRGSPGIPLVRDRRANTCFLRLFECPRKGSKTWVPLSRHGIVDSVSASNRTFCSDGSNFAAFTEFAEGQT